MMRLGATEPGIRRKIIGWRARTLDNSADTDPLASGEETSFGLTREDHLVLGLLQVLARLHALKGQITQADLTRLPNLRPFLEAGDRLTQDLGFADE